MRLTFPKRTCSRLEGVIQEGDRLCHSSSFSDKVSNPYDSFIAQCSAIMEGLRFAKLNMVCLQVNIVICLLP